MARLSVMGLYDYDPTIFDLMVLPDGIEKTVLINEIFLESFDLECVYPNPDFLKILIGNWSKANIYNWEELYKTLMYDYNPIYNRFYESTETETRDLANTVNQSDGHKLDRVGKDGRVMQNAQTNSSTNSVNAYNDGNWVKREKDDFIGAQIGQDTLNYNVNDSYEGDLDRKGTDTGTITKHSKGGGNIGVTTTQKLIKEQREIVKFNLYKYITNEFIKVFCIQIY